MAWCFSTRASVATVLTTHPCVSRCLRVNVGWFMLNKAYPIISLNKAYPILSLNKAYPILSLNKDYPILSYLVFNVVTLIKWLHHANHRLACEWTLPPTKYACTVRDLLYIVLVLHRAIWPISFTVASPGLRQPVPTKQTPKNIDKYIIWMH